MRSRKRGPDDREEVRATEEEPIEMCSRGIIVPRPLVVVSLRGGPLDGRVMSRTGWNGAVQLGRVWEQRTGRHRAYLDYAPEALLDELDIPLLYTGGVQ